MEDLDQVEIEKIKSKMKLYALLSGVFFLRGIYLKDQEIINCSLLLLGTCGTFYWIANKEE